MHNCLKPKQCGKPEAVHYSLQEQYWGKNVYLNIHTSWEGISLGCYNRDFIIILWSRDASNAFEIQKRTNVTFSQSNNEIRKRKKPDYFCSSACL